MTIISQSVGAGAKNIKADVIAVQQLLNKFNATLSFQPVIADGNCGAKTLTSIRNFQTIKMGIANPNGLIMPGGPTIMALSAFSAQPDRSKLSGASWWHANQGKYMNSVRVADLAPDFQQRVLVFINAMKAAGASVAVNSTRRSKIRAYLMHYSWRLAANEIAAKDIPKEPGCDIIWDHGDGARSRQAAKEMRDLFGIVYEPSLTSRHISGNAIDMNIGWSGTIKVRNAAGQLIFLTTPANGNNTSLHKIGVGYGVYKLVSDAPHWSNDGG